MKQRITVDQLMEITIKQKKVLRKWADRNDKRTDYPNWLHWENSNKGIISHKYDILPLLTIGQMIEFLGDKRMQKFILQFGETLPLNKTLCDDLWEAVKEVCNNE